MATPVKVGLFGGGRGDRKNIDPGKPPKSLTSIEIWSSKDGEGSRGIINGIRFTYVDTHGRQNTSPVWGNDSGESHQIVIDTGGQEYVKKIEGTVGSAPDGDSAVSSLKVTTNQTEYEAYGDRRNGVPFSVPLEGAGIFAFYGRSSSYLNAVGFYVLPYP